MASFAQGDVEPNCGPGGVRILLKELTLSLKKSIKWPRVRIQVEEDNVVHQIDDEDIGVGKTSVSAFSCVREGQVREILLTPGSYVVHFQLYEHANEKSGGRLRGSVACKISEILLAGSRDLSVDRPLYNLDSSGTVIGRLSVCMKILLSQVPRTLPVRPTLNGIPILNALYNTIEKFLPLVSVVANTQLYNHALIMLTLAYYACDTILTGVTVMLFKDDKNSLGVVTDTNGRKTFNIRARDSELPRILQAARLPQNNAVDDLVGQLYGQIAYAQTCLSRHEEGQEACEGAREDLIELLDELVRETLYAAFLVHGFADIYPDTEYSAFELAQKESKTAYNAYNDFQARNFHLARLRAYMQMSQHPRFQVPVDNQSAVVFVRSLLDLTIQETMVGKYIYYRKIVHCLRGQNAQELYNMLKSDLEYCQGRQSLRQRRDVLRRIMTSFAQATGSIPSYLVMKNIVHERDLGNGGYGAIALCIWHKRSKADRIQVVTKTLTMFDDRKTTEEALKHMLLEVMSIQSLRHRHIIQVLGIFRSAYLPSIVLPYIKNDHLGKRLTVLKESAYSYAPGAITAMVNRWIGHIALGMAYLHGEEIAHGDLRKVNVLVDDDDMAVISDFGLAAYLHGRSQHYASTRSGNPMWLAPELLNERTGQRENNVRQTSQSDVYSFASLCVEVYGNTLTPYPAVRNLSSEDVRAIKRGEKHPDRPRDPEDRQEMTEPLWNMLRECWKVDPCARPSADEVAVRLTKAPMAFIGEDHSVEPTRRL